MTAAVSGQKLAGKPKLRTFHSLETIFPLLRLIISALA